MKAIKRIATACALSLTTLSANAVLIDKGNYFTDTSSGLDWLDMTPTIGLSYQYVSNQLGLGGDYIGYRYATEAEFNQLLTEASGTRINSNQTYYVQSTPGEMSYIHKLIEMFGTVNAYSNTSSTNQYNMGILGDACYIKFPRGCSNTTPARLMAEFGHSISNNGDHWGYHITGNHLMSETYGSPQVASFLVKPTIAPVSESGFLGLMISGLFGLMLFKRK